MMRIFVPLDETQKRALIRYAELQYRDPRIQAALFIQRGLEQAGAYDRENKDAPQEAQHATPAS